MPYVISMIEAFQSSAFIIEGFFKIFVIVCIKSHIQWPPLWTILQSVEASSCHISNIVVRTQLYSRPSQMLHIIIFLCCVFIFLVGSANFRSITDNRCDHSTKHLIRFITKLTNVYNNHEPITQHLVLSVRLSVRHSTNATFFIDQ